MTGRFIAVVGPSGVGKDSVMRAMAADPRLVLARRVITRPGDAGGEDFEGVSESRFLQMQTAGEFALSWPAHGLHYGIPVTVDRTLEQGVDMLANLSRAQIVTAKQRFERCEVIVLTAKREVLAQRLMARGRESAEQVEHRLNRASFALPDGVAAHIVDNSGPLDLAVQTALSLLYPARS
ncbi:phosphonate metabolism protein/1,5-bisphosphokinase (PRPP-forming) PhnN [Yoonia maritima]|uniref:phosphonate metabolism protein/1,5-bisphosphokinase (PRPP-forming) PhnN n=1 Tax=Yoonia maritima TaxID=1435347 RepID=UPI0037353EDC